MAGVGGGRHQLVYGDTIRAVTLLSIRSHLQPVYNKKMKNRVPVMSGNLMEGLSLVWEKKNRIILNSMLREFAILSCEAPKLV